MNIPCLKPHYYRHAHTCSLAYHHSHVFTLFKSAHQYRHAHSITTTHTFVCSSKLVHIKNPSNPPSWVQTNTPAKLIEKPGETGKHDLVLFYLYNNEKTYGSPANTIKRQISYILETAPTHATEYN